MRIQPPLPTHSVPNFCDNYIIARGPEEDLLGMNARILACGPDSPPDWPGGRVEMRDVQQTAETRELRSEGPRSVNASPFDPALALPPRVTLRTLPTLLYDAPSEHRESGTSLNRSRFEPALVATATWNLESPWSPPVGWLCAVSACFPALELRLRYHVDDVPCAGWGTFVAGTWEGDEYQDEDRIHEVVTQMSTGLR